MLSTATLVSFPYSILVFYELLIVPYRAHIFGCTPNASRTSNGVVGLCFFMTGYDFCRNCLC